MKLKCVRFSSYFFMLFIRVLILIFLVISRIQNCYQLMYSWSVSHCRVSFEYRQKNSPTKRCNLPVRTVRLVLLLCRPLALPIKRTQAKWINRTESCFCCIDTYAIVKFIMESMQRMVPIERKALWFRKNFLVSVHPNDCVSHKLLELRIALVARQTNPFHSGIPTSECAFFCIMCGCFVFIYMRRCVIVSAHMLKNQLSVFSRLCKFYLKITRVHVCMCI